MTSLDGVSFDQNAGEALAAGDEWEAQYPFRQDGQLGVFAKTTPDNVRLQGFLVRPQGSTNFDGFLFDLPSAYRPGNTVYVPVNLAGRTPSQAWGYISIYPSGDVYVPWNVPAANLGTSLEGAWFSKTLSAGSERPQHGASGERCWPRVLADARGPRYLRGDRDLTAAIASARRESARKHG